MQNFLQLVAATARLKFLDITQQIRQSSTHVPFFHKRPLVLAHPVLFQEDLRFSVDAFCLLRAVPYAIECREYEINFHTIVRVELALNEIGDFVAAVFQKARRFGVIMIHQNFRINALFKGRRALLQRNFSILTVVFA